MRDEYHESRYKVEAEANVKSNKARRSSGKREAEAIRPVPPDEESGMRARKRSARARFHAADRQSSRRRPTSWQAPAIEYKACTATGGCCVRDPMRSKPFHFEILFVPRQRGTRHLRERLRWLESSLPGILRCSVRRKAISPKIYFDRRMAIRSRHVRGRSRPQPGDRSRAEQAGPGPCVR